MPSPVSRTTVWSTACTARPIDVPARPRRQGGSSRSTASASGSSAGASAAPLSPVAEIVHARGRSIARAPAAAERRYRLSQLAFYEKHHPRWLPWLRAYLRIRGKLPSGVGAAGAPR